ncbi:hypothetical protein [Nocardia brasiliensis]|uniref:hypothetical protein n=1 Tax=Nocardia brasiliensis TaxID=37326 RepID=UPI00366C1CAB
MATAYATLEVIPTVRGIRGGIERQISRPLTTAGQKAGRDAGAAIVSGIESKDYEGAGRSAANRFANGFAAGMRSITTGFGIATKAASLFIVNASTIATGFGLAAKVVRSFSAATFISALALRQVASTGLTKLAGALRIIAAIASRVAREIGQITAAFLVLQGLVRVASFMTNFAKRLAMMTVGGAAAIGVVSGLATIVGGALVSALSAGVIALGAFAGAAAGLGGPAIFALKVGMKGLSDGAAEFNKQFADADEALNKMVGQRMGPMLTAFRTMRVEMIDRFSAELTPAFQRIGVGIDQVRGKFGWMSVYLGQIGQDIAMSLTGPDTINAFQKMGDASGVFFQHLNKGESGLGGLSTGLVTFASTAATTFQDSSRGLNDLFLDIGEKLRSITPEQIRGALAQFRQVFENIANVAGPLFNLFRQLGQISAVGLAPGFAAVGNAIREATPALLNMGSIIMPALGRVMQELAPLIPRLVEAFTPWASMLATVAPYLASLVAHMAPLAPYLLMIAAGFKVASAVMLLWNAATFAGAVAQGVFAAATGRSAATLAGNTIALAAHRVALIAGAVAARAFGVAMAFATGPIGLIVLAVAAVGAALWAFFTKTEVGKKWWDAIWTGIKTAVSATWAFLGPIFSAIGSWFTETAVPAVMNFWHGAVQPAFSAIGSLISAWWSGIVQPVFENLKFGIGLVGAAFSFFKDNVVVPVTKGIGTAISFAWENVVSPIFDKLKTGIGLVGDAFGAAGGVIKTMWGGIADILRPAVHFLGNILAGVPSKIGPIEIPGAGAAQDLGKKMQAFRNGGPVSGAGTGTSDSILAAVSNGEFIVRARYAQQWLPLLEAINAGKLPAFATGGLVDIQQWARGEAGKPYQYGGTGNPSWDCSGIAGALWAQATGKNPNARYFTTDSDFAALGFKPGLGGPTDLSIGTNGGSGTGGHMASTLGDLNVESSGTDGVEIGSAAQGAADFPYKWHWPIGGNPLSSGVGTGGASAGGSGGLGSGGTGGGTGGTGTSDGASSSGSTSRPSGTAVPVWVDNWPSSMTSSSSASTAASDTTTSAAPSSVSPTADNTDGSFDQTGAVNAAFSKFNSAMSDAGSAFVKGQRSSIPGIGGYADDIEKTVNNWQIVVADVYEAVNAITREQKRQTAGK